MIRRLLSYLADSTTRAALAQTAQAVRIAEGYRQALAVEIQARTDLEVRNRCLMLALRVSEDSAATRGRLLSEALKREADRGRGVILLSPAELHALETIEPGRA